MRDEKLWADERTYEMRILPKGSPLPTGFSMNIYAVHFLCKFLINVDQPNKKQLRNATHRF